MLKFINFILLVVLMFNVFGTQVAFGADESETVLLKGFVESVPQAIYGSWRVVSKRVDTDSPAIFKSEGIDLWNLSLENDVINLSNPFSGASAKIEIKNVDGNTVTFTKKGKYGNKILTDTVTINIQADKFEGSDRLKLDTISDVSGKIIKSEMAIYSVKGEKISGNSILD